MTRRLPKAVLKELRDFADARLAAAQGRAQREVAVFSHRVGKDRLARRRETMIWLLEGGFASSLKEAYRLAAELEGRK